MKRTEKSLQQPHKHHLVSTRMLLTHNTGMENAATIIQKAVGLPTARTFITVVEKATSPAYAGDLTDSTWGKNAVP